MVALTVVRHGQASFGAADYDVLSEKGHAQAYALGQALKAQGLRPERFVTGTLRRQKETMAGLLEGLGLSAQVEEHPGLDEYDFAGLLAARFRDGGAPDGMMQDAKTHFRTLRAVVGEWQRDAVADPPETWAAFTARVEAARAHMAREGAQSVLAVSSGGAIGQLAAAALGAPGAAQLALQLQMKNCAVTRLLVTPRQTWLTGFNETPHIDAATEAAFLSYS